MIFLVKYSFSFLEKQIYWLSDLPVFVRLVTQVPKFLVASLVISDLKANAGSLVSSLFLPLDIACFVLLRVRAGPEKR